MHIQHNPLLRPIRIQVHHLLPVELWIRLMDNAVVVRADDHLIVCVVVQAFDIIIDMMRLGDRRAELLPDQLPAELTSVAVQELKVFSDLAVQLPDPRQPFIQDESRLGINIIVIEVRFYLALALVFDQFPEFLQIVCNNGFQNIAIVIFSRVDRRVLFAVLGKRYGFPGSGGLQSFGMFDI